MRPAVLSLVIGTFLIMNVADVHANTILTVGASGADYTTVNAAVQFADTQTGSYYTIEINPGTYVNDFSVVTVPMAIEASGGTVILDATEPPPNGKAIITTSASTIIVGLTLEGAGVSPSQGANGAGIRDQAGTSSLVVENSIFMNDQNGILADADLTNNISISNSRFISDGFDAGGGACPSSGCDHAIYIGAVNSLDVTDSLVCGTLVGHDVKSRAAKTTLTDNQLYDGAADNAIGCPAGSTSYAVDLPNGGAGTISGNQIIQGPATQNSTMLRYGEEGLIYNNNSLSLSDNLLISNDVSQSTGVNDPPCIPVQLQNNTFQGVNTPVNPPSCAEYIGQSVPEPASFLMLLSGFVGCFAMRASKYRSGCLHRWAALSEFRTGEIRSPAAAWLRISKPDRSLQQDLLIMSSREHAGRD